ncbi:hypothetical protein [Kytococcus sp. Marseille-QA3725]
MGIRHARRRPEELVGHELWWLSSLHGISGVSAWQHDGQELGLSEPERAEVWYEALARMP